MLSETSKFDVDESDSSNDDPMVLDELNEDEVEHDPF
jgi:hypothetical protein